MIKKFVERWDKYKCDLADYFRNTSQKYYSEYIDILKALFEYVINRDEEQYNLENIHVIDDDDVIGTQIFILHEDTYIPKINDYIYTHNFYGSCCGCDTLKEIRYRELDTIDSLPNEKQVKDYMTLALHLLQRIKKFVQYDEVE